MAIRGGGRPPWTSPVALDRCAHLGALVGSEPAVNRKMASCCSKSCSGSAEIGQVWADLRPILTRTRPLFGEICQLPAYSGPRSLGGSRSGAASPSDDLCITRLGSRQDWPCCGREPGVQNGCFWPIWGKHWPLPQRIWPVYGELGNLWRDFGQFWVTSASSGQFWSEIGQCGRNWPSMLRIRPISGLGGIGRCLCNTCRNWTNFGGIRLMCLSNILVQHVSKPYQILADSGPSLVEIARCLSNMRRTWNSP